MAYEYFYPGTPYSLEPEYGSVFTGYRVMAGELGASTSIQTANQVKEVTNLLNQGMKNVEVSAIKQDVFEMIPKEHLKEINRLSKLTGAETSLHAPMTDPSGFTEQGWDEVNRQEAEKQFKEILERSHELNPKGNIPVTVHASAVPGTEYIPMEKDGKMIEVPQRMVAVNRETGEFIPLIREERFYPLKEEGKEYKGKLYEPEQELEIANDSYWDRQLSQLTFYKERGDDILVRNYPLYAGEKAELLTDEQKRARDYSMNNAMIYLKNTHQSLNSLFNQAYKFSNTEAKEELKKAAEKFTELYKKSAEKGGLNPSIYSGALQSMISSMQKITDTKELTPQIYKPIEDFVKEKATQTLSGAAFDSYKKFGNSSPILSIENPPYGVAMARAEDLKALIEETRKKFVEKAVSDGMSKSAAEDASKKLIGATWDTSHISMMRKQGFKPEKLIEEAKIIAPFVKHVHYNDNFGSSHTDLPPGMGSVPMKEVMTELEKAGFKGKKIFEGGAFFQHFQTSPHPYVLEGSGSPLYGMMAPPYWNQAVSTYGNYFSLPSSYFPEQHFSMYGGGFSSLPAELGGQMPGKQSRATGTPMD